MGNIFHFTKFNRVFLCGTLIAFSLVNIPTPCYSQNNVGVNDVAFAYRIEKLLEKVKRSADKNDSNKLIDLMLDVKREVEVYSGTSIDLDKQLDAVEAEIRKKGTKIPKAEFKELKKILKKKEKKVHLRALYLEKCLLNPEIPYSLEEELLFYEKHGHDDKEEIELILPIQLTVGVTVALVGLFIIVTPVIPPPIKVWGKDMVVYGVGIAAEACYSAYDGNKNKKD
jgi:hypothetical protein